MYNFTEKNLINYVLLIGQIDVLETSLNQLYSMLRARGVKLLPLMDNLLRANASGGIIVSRDVLRLGKEY